MKRTGIACIIFLPREVQHRNDTKERVMSLKRENIKLGDFFNIVCKKLSFIYYRESNCIILQHPSEAIIERRPYEFEKSFGCLNREEHILAYINCLDIIFERYGLRIISSGMVCHFLKEKNLIY